MTAHDPFFRDVQSFYPVTGNFFKRRGAWFGLSVTASAYGMAALHLATFHGGATRAKDGNKLIDLWPTYEGRRVPFVVQAEADELTLLTRYGNVRFTFAGPTLLMAEGDKGMGLHFEKDMEQHETVKPRKNGAWEAAFRWTCSMLFQGLEGSGITFRPYWDWERLSSGNVKADTVPGPEGHFTLAMEEFTHAAFPRENYPTYSEARESMKADWEGFLAQMPAFPEPYEKGRIQAAYTLWSYLTAPTMGIDHTMIVMIGQEIASQWQMCQNAVALEPHLDISLDLLLSPLDRVSPYGQFSDLYNDATCVPQMIKPPVHGWALKQLMARRDLKKEVLADKLETLYKAVSDWGNWFLLCRDEDGDGLPAYEHGDETGFDDCTLFIDHMQMASPDLSAYLVLLYEALGDLALLLGKKDEAGDWERKSKELLDRMIGEMWDGKHFVGIVPWTHEKVFSGSLIHYIPVVLGDRLPPEILDKLAADLTEEGVFLSPWGLSTERMDSDWFEATGRSISRGNIVPPSMLFICAGLLGSRRRDAGRLITERYLSALSTQGMPFLIHPMLGNVFGFAGGSWPACAYTILGRLLSEDMAAHGA
ncbi:MAG: hypothetical protein IKO91_02620 [Oscillospiraceae bacterium]|nr:hypothetical protein [Oscillospiraceae bacterium]